ncbi:uncharacterized protein At1g65710 [Euphorbia lathyris]|uniref:uncharacterized protein At1g65710 n=1 Tax=Euphorbia lathyris TaxID=212925 RepID=UPI0033134E2D
MGACLSSKKESSSSSSSLNVSLPAAEAKAPNKFVDSDTPLKGEIPEAKIKGKAVVEEEEKVKKQVAVAVAEEDNFVKKEIFVIKHRKSHDRERPSVSKEEEEHKLSSAVSNHSENCSNVSNSVVRTSSCTKEEVDAILIQCGRLSRSNSSGIAAKVASSGRKYAGSKRSFDLDQEQDEVAASSSSADYEARKRPNDDDEEDEDRRQHHQRNRHRQSGRRTHSSPSQGRRRTPSRERDGDQRSGSRERGNGSTTTTSSGRRVSRSPGRRSETTPTPNSNTTSKPGKMVSVPATVSSLTMDKSNNAVESQTATGVKRISVKRNAGEAAGSRTAASPRSQSPARCNARGGSNENNNQQQQPSLSRSNSRKAEHSPYRRNPLSEIDPNSLVYAPATGNNKANNGTGRVQSKNREAEVQAVVKEVVNQKPNADTNNNRVAAQGTNKIVKEQTVVVEEAKAMPQTLTRSRSARRSRDLDFNPETLMNPNPSYTALLLEDIHNFHQKNTNTNPNAPSFSVPACVTKACSIVEAVADLNSTTSSNLSCAFGEDKRIPVGKKVVDVKDPFVESEVVVSDDLMEPSFHKYVTVRRGGNGTLCGEDMDEQESSGSNSFVGGSHNNNHWGYSTSSWEPNSADSTDRWTSRSNTREDDQRSPLGFQKHIVSETGIDMEEARRGFSGQRTGIGRRFPTVAAAST